MSEWTIAGRHALVTGATSGIGLSVAIALAARGARLTLAGRDRSRGSAAVGLVRAASGNDDVHFLPVDLASLQSVRAASDAYLARGLPLHVLVNNAGIFNARRRLSCDSIEEMFGVNYLAHVLLTRRLLPRMCESGGARIIHVASGAHQRCHRVNFLDLNHARAFSAYAVYAHSKLANVLFSNELARRLDGGVTSNAMNPGVVATALGSNNGTIGRLVMRIGRPFLRTPEQGADTVVHLASDPALGAVSGQYFMDRAPREPAPTATDPYEARRLWEMSERLLDGYL